MKRRVFLIGLAAAMAVGVLRPPKVEEGPLTFNGIPVIWDEPWMTDRVERIYRENWRRGEWVKPFLP